MRTIEIAAQLRTAGSVFAEDEAELFFAEARSKDELAQMVARRIAGEPVELIVGWSEFCGHRVMVGPGVFIPRVRTEAMANEAIQRSQRGAVLVDLCCGSGAVGLAVARAVPGVEVHAADIDEVAVRCASSNLLSLGRTYVGDLFDALPPELAGRVNILVANTPYVPSAEIPLMPHEAREYEPHHTLDGGPDGLDIQRRIASAAPEWLAAGGCLLFEASTAQVPTSMEILIEGGLAATHAYDDELESNVVIGIKN